jgi:predicted patatin/cPLA2 family phospholipase
MKVKKFIEDIKEYLGLEEFEKIDKKRAVEILLENLESKYEQTKQKLEKSPEDKELIEKIDIISLHIKKAKKILKKLNA